MVGKNERSDTDEKKDIRNIGTTVEEREEEKREILSETCFLGFGGVRYRIASKLAEGTFCSCKDDRERYAAAKKRDERQGFESKETKGRGRDSRVFSAGTAGLPPEKVVS